MKKVIYGILILIGVAAITSNFIVDSSKLDHKKVSASGTACRWISNTGYGTGPIYFDGVSYYEWYEDFFHDLKILPCNVSTNANKTYSAQFFYNINGEKLNLFTSNNNIWFKDGLMYGKLCTVRSGTNTSNMSCVQYQNFNQKIYYLIPGYAAIDVGGESVNNLSGTVIYHGNLAEGLSELEYTCVCAEY